MFQTYDKNIQSPEHHRSGKVELLCLKKNGNKFEILLKTCSCLTSNAYLGFFIPLDEGHPEFVINEAISVDAAWPPRSDTGGSGIISVCVDYREDIKLLLLSLR